VEYLFGNIATSCVVFVVKQRARFNDSLDEAMTTRFAWLRRSSTPIWSG
jgi:hypothetical protein